MQHIRNIKVGARLALGFGLVVGLFLIVTATLYSGGLMVGGFSAKIAACGLAAA